MISKRHGSGETGDDVFLVDCGMSFDQRNKLIHASAPDFCPERKMKRRRGGRRLAFPFPIRRLAMHRVLFAGMRGFIAAERHAEKIPAKHPENIRHPRLLHRPRSRGKRGNPSRAHPEFCRPELSAERGDARLHVSVFNQRGFLSEDDGFFHGGLREISQKRPCQESGKQFFSKGIITVFS